MNKGSLLSNPAQNALQQLIKATLGIQLQAMVLTGIVVNLSILALISSVQSKDDYNCRCPFGTKPTYNYCGEELMQLNKVAKEKVHQATCESGRIYWCLMPKDAAFASTLCENGTVCSYPIKPSKSPRHPTAKFRDCVNKTDLEDVPKTED